VEVDLVAELTVLVVAVAILVVVRKAGVMTVPAAALTITVPINPTLAVQVLLETVM
jgi:hypothetical protein